MKLANICWMNTELNSGSSAVNFGDILQFRVLDAILEENFTDEEILKISMSDMKSYKGEKLVVPMNWALFDLNYMDGNKLSISKDIIPVFLAVTIESGNFKKEFINDDNINYLKKYEPIGCRDEKTKSVLEENGVEAYINGCMTSTLSKRGVKGEKIIFVDVPIELERYIPSWDGEIIEVFTQQQYFEPSFDVEKIRRLVDERYDYYFNEAKLVVTSRLHVASPCMAVGIPVIFAKNIVDARFMWLDSYIPLYSHKEFNMIKWDATLNNYEDKKEIIKKNAVNRIANVFYGDNREIFIKKIDSFYKMHDSFFPPFAETINNNLKKLELFLDDNYDVNDELEYAIWGLGQAAENLYSFICEKYKRFRLIAALDMYKVGSFHGKQIIKPCEYKNIEGAVVFVTSVHASNVANELLTQQGINKESIVCLGDVFIK